MANHMINIRKATRSDLDFLIQADRLADGCTPGTAEEQAAHREKISTFISSSDDCGWIAEDAVTCTKAGMILARFRDRDHEPDTETNRFLFRFLDESIIPADGRFCEVFQLWVDPACRRQGIATRLKQQIEVESRQRGIPMIYTHTESRNTHVIALNQKLGYQIVRVGPIWDDVPRTSLVKWLKK